jgi:hypothetical protein
MGSKFAAFLQPENARRPRKLTFVWVNRFCTREDVPPLAKTTSGSMAQLAKRAPRRE